MTRIDRRQFIRGSAAGAAAVAAGACGSSWQLSDRSAIKGSASRAPVSTLVQVKGAAVERNLRPALVKLLEPLGGMRAFVKRGQTVLLKPNLAFDRPAAYRSATTPALIAAVAALARAQGAGRVIVADHAVDDTEDVIKTIGLREALAGTGAELMAVGRDGPWVERPIPAGKSLTSAELLETALGADVHIALPIAKSHGSAGFTGTLKGMMGLIKSRAGFHMVRDLHQSIVDLNTVLRPQLIIMDGLEVMTDGGPQGPGKLVRTDSLIAGTDPVAVDAAGVRLAPLYGKRVDPATIRHLALAAAGGLGRIELPRERVHRIAL